MLVLVFGGNYFVMFVGRKQNLNSSPQSLQPFSPQEAGIGIKALNGIKFY
jgi:hypothetical protein